MTLDSQRHLTGSTSGRSTTATTDDGCGTPKNALCFRGQDVGADALRHRVVLLDERIHVQGEQLAVADDHLAVDDRQIHLCPKRRKVDIRAAFVNARSSCTGQA